jgi:hypothetical protein
MIVNRMRLHQHSTRCPIALRSFLDCNPQYWCFVPKLLQNVDMNDNRNRPIVVEHDDDLYQPRINRRLCQVPLPPVAYYFTTRQRQQQRLFFHRLYSLPFGGLPFQSLDVYQVSIIAVCEFIL